MLAPFTLYTGHGFGSDSESIVQWFSADGKLEGELHDVSLSEEPYVELSRSAGTTYVSIQTAVPRWLQDLDH